MPLTPDAATLSAYLEPRLDHYIEELGQLCAIECPSASKAGVDAAGAWVRRWAAARGWTLRAWPDAVAGDSLLVTLRGNDPRGLRALLVAHLDTVYPVGTAAERPLRRDGDTLLAPGAADNKSGLLSGLYAMAALEECGLLASFAEIGLVCGSDEETDMRVSGALLAELAPAYDVALVLEAGRANGNIVVARKGIGTWTLAVTGKSAHAGVEPQKGANAILALAQQVVALQLLNGMRPGATLNVGAISGGTVPNVVPDAARAEFEVRVVHPEDMEPIGAAIERIAAHPAVAGTTGHLEGGWRIAPMARTPEITALAHRANTCAEELGFSVGDTATGGISYANVLAALGLPVLDGLGPVGGLVHSPDEYVLARSIVPRTALLALLLLRRAQG